MKSSIVTTVSLKLAQLNNLNKTILTTLFIAFLGLSMGVFFELTLPILNYFLDNFYSIAIFYTISFAFPLWMFLSTKNRTQAFYFILINLCFIVLVFSSGYAYEIDSLNMNNYQEFYIAFLFVCSFISSCCSILRSLIMFIEKV
jgi:hypothetical protein